MVALLSSATKCASESFPVIHTAPITVRILGGKDGQPLGRVHLTLIGGYDPRDMRQELFREEVLTDPHGQIQLSNQLANLPWLQVWVGKRSLCQQNPRSASFSVDLMRRSGLTTPNRCGKATVEDHPGVFTVLVKGNGAPQPGPAIEPEPPPAPITGATSATCCRSAKKMRRAGIACGRLVFLLPGFAFYLH